MNTTNNKVDRQLKLQENIVKKLQDKENSKLKKLANIVSKEEPTMVKEKTKQKVYNVFKDSLSDESREKIEKIDSRIHKIIKEICRHSGWDFKSEGFYKQDAKIGNSYDTERVTYLVKRTKEGFKPSREEETDWWYSNKLRQKEVDFIDKYKDLLEECHNLLNIKDSFMKGDFEVKEEDDELNKTIAEYLNYNVDNSESFNGYLNHKK